jgi:hypothetical protein
MASAVPLLFLGGGEKDLRRVHPDRVVVNAGRRVRREERRGERPEGRARGEIVRTWGAGVGVNP